MAESIRFTRRQVSGLALGLAAATAPNLFTSLAWAAKAYDTGATDTEIKIGQPVPYSGPVSFYGAIGKTTLGYFRMLNEEQGGIKGRKITVISLDDGYEPEKTIEATKKLITEEKVFALVGAVGTPTSKAGQPIATEAKVPFIGPFTGAEFLRSPYNRYVVNVRCSYFQETEAWIEHLTKDLGISKIAILYQDDAFGLAGLEGVRIALAKRNMSLVASGTFRRNTTAIKSALLDIMKAKPQAVVTVGPYKPIAEFVKLARQQKFDPVFVAISFVGSDALAHELGGSGSGVIVSQVVPFPGDASIPVVAAYQLAMKALSPRSKPGFVSLEGYLVGRLVVETLKRTPDEPSREAFLDQFAKGDFDLGGVILNYMPSKNQGMNQVFFTVLQSDGSFRPVTQLLKTTRR